MPLLLAVALAAPLPVAPDTVTDGAITAWTGPETFTLGATAQIAGRSKVASPDDLQARVWLAVDGADLILAADVRDDALRAAGPGADGATRVRADHLELWLSFAEPDLPPIAFGNQFGTFPVPTVAACAEPDVAEPEACVAWHGAQVTHRRGLEERFVRQYVVDGRGVSPVAGGQLQAPVGAAALVPRPGGWTLEARVPFHALPALRSVNTATVRALVELVDNDVDHSRQESFLSGTPGRSLADRSTWSVLTREGAWRVVDPQGRVSWALTRGYHVLPGEPGVVWRFENVPVGYQYSPTEPSPSLLRAPVPERPLHTGPDVTLWSLDDGVAHHVLSASGGAVRDDWTVACADPPEITVRDGRHELAWWCAVSNSPHGAGMCGACPALDVHIVTLGPDGRARVLLETFLTSAPDGGDLSRTRSPDGAWIAVRTPSFQDDGSEVWRGWTLTWDPVQRRYLEVDGLPASARW